MSLSLVLLLLILMGIVQPIIEAKHSVNLSTVVGFGLSSVSGILWSFVKVNNNNRKGEEKEVLLHNFYGCCISACLAPFVVLNQISDRKKMTKYSIEEVKLLALICAIAIINQTFIETKIRSNYSYSEQ